MDDLISRQAAIDAVDSETVSTNPEHFKSSEKFIEFMDDTDIASFGKWQWANGFNTALVATTVQLKNLPSAERRGRWEDVAHAPNGLYYATCSVCGKRQTTEATNYCGNCGERMVEERMIRAINAREAVEFLRENDLTITRCKSCNQHKDIDNRCYCHKLEMYVDVDWFCKDAKADKCATCFIPMFYNLEDDDSICRDCEAEE